MCYVCITQLCILYRAVWTVLGTVCAAVVWSVPLTLILKKDTDVRLLTNQTSSCPLSEIYHDPVQDLLAFVYLSSLALVSEHYYKCLKCPRGGKNEIHSKYIDYIMKRHRKHTTKTNPHLSTQPLNASLSELCHIWKVSSLNLWLGFWERGIQKRTANC